MAKTHIDTIDSNLAKLSGVFDKLKRYLPEYVLRTLYCCMVQSRLAYGILAWGFSHLEKFKTGSLGLYRVANIMLKLILIAFMSLYSTLKGVIWIAVEIMIISSKYMSQRQS